MTFAELTALPAVGEPTAARIKAAFELGRRLLVTQPHERPVVRAPADAANMLMPEMGLLDQEELRMILLDLRNRILAIETLYRGNLNSAAVRVGEVFKGAIRRNAAAILLLHNHPSQDPTPSPATRRARNQAHAAFDALWQRKMARGTPRKEARNAGYAWLAREMGLDLEDTHIGSFTQEQCARVVELCRPYLSSRTSGSA